MLTEERKKGNERRGGRVRKDKTANEELKMTQEEERTDNRRGRRETIERRKRKRKGEDEK